MADNWRSNACHRFSDGPPSNTQAVYFIITTIRNHFNSDRTIIVDSQVVYYEPDENELSEAEEWFQAHKDQIVGVDCGLILCFLSGQWNMVSLDRKNSRMGANEIGQEWLVSSWIMNR